MPKAAADTTSVKVQVTLPEPVYDSYAERAAKLNRRIETELADRLTKCQSYTSLTPVYLDDQARNHLTVILGRTIQTSDDIIKHIEEAASIKVGDVTIPLDSQLLTRLHSRCFGDSIAHVIEREVLRALREFTGLY